MRNDKRFVFVPYWIIDSLKRRGHNVSVMADMKEMRRLLSKEDIATCSALNDIMARELNAFWTVRDWTAFSAPKSPKPICEVATGFTELFNETDYDIISMSNLPSLVESLVSRLQANDDEKGSEGSIIIYDTDLTRAVVSLPSGIFKNGTKVPRKHAQELLRSILRVLYVYKPRYEVARTGLTQLYLESLI